MTPCGVAQCGARGVCLVCLSTTRPARISIETPVSLRSERFLSRSMCIAGFVVTLPTLYVRCDFLLQPVQLSYTIVSHSTCYDIRLCSLDLLSVVTNFVRNVNDGEFSCFYPRHFLERSGVELQEKTMLKRSIVQCASSCIANMSSRLIVTILSGHLPSALQPLSRPPSLRLRRDMLRSFCVNISFAVLAAAGSPLSLSLMCVIRMT